MHSSRIDDGLDDFASACLTRDRAQGVVRIVRVVKEHAEHIELVPDGNCSAALRSLGWRNGRPFPLRSRPFPLRNGCVTAAYLLRNAACEGFGLLQLQAPR